MKEYPKRGFVWNRLTPPQGLRAFGFDFGPFAIVILLDKKGKSWRCGICKSKNL